MREIKFRAWDKEMNQMWNAGDFHLSSDGFAFTCSGGFDCDASIDCIVIGNIHENPELLEEEK